MQTLTEVGYLAVPPVRRNGPRESLKENIEAAEIDYALGHVAGMLAVVDANVDEAEGIISSDLDTVTTAMNTTQTTVSARS